MFNHDCSELIYSGSDFRIHLQEELLRRCKSNPRYSLRAFAKSLNFPPSLLSMIFSGKRKISRRSAKIFAEKLNIPYESIAVLHSSYKQIAFDQFKVIADWYHYAILELISVENFRSEPEWIAKTLGISSHEAKSAIERLIRINLISVSKDGHLKNISGDNTNLDNELVAIARKKLQRQILEKALEALDQTPLERRDQSSMTMAIDSKKLKEAKRRLTQFRREFTQFLQAGRDKNSVYHLSLSFYPVTHSPVKENTK